MVKYWPIVAIALGGYFWTGIRATFIEDDPIRGVIRLVVASIAVYALARMVVEQS